MAGGEDRLRAAAHELRQYAYRHAVPILIAPRNAQPNALNSGSGCFVRLRGGVFLLTAWHVVAHWIARQAEAAAPVLFQVGTGVALDPQAQLVWSDQANDIAFVRVTEQQVRTTGVSVCEPLPGWPPVHPITNAEVFVAGFPLPLRVREGVQDVLFRSLCLQLTVQDTRENLITCIFNDGELTAQDGTRFGVADFDLGGMSGGPVFFVGQLSYPVVAVVRDCALGVIRFATLSHCDAPVLLGQ